MSRRSSEPTSRRGGSARRSWRRPGDRSVTLAARGALTRRDREADGPSLENPAGYRLTVVGTIVITDEGWYSFLAEREELTELDFWTPSARRSFRAPTFSPFLFKLRAPHKAICGFAYLLSSRRSRIGSRGRRSVLETDAPASRRYTPALG